MLCSYLKVIDNGLRLQYNILKTMIVDYIVKIENDRYRSHDWTDDRSDVGRQRLDRWKHLLLACVRPLIPRG